MPIDIDEETSQQGTIDLEDFIDEDEDRLPLIDLDVHWDEDRDETCEFCGWTYSDEYIPPQWKLDPDEISIKIVENYNKYGIYMNCEICSRKGCCSCIVRTCCTTN